MKLDIWIPTTNPIGQKQNRKYKSENQNGGGRHIDFYRNRHKSAKYQPILMKFDMRIPCTILNQKKTKPEVEIQNSRWRRPPINSSGETHYYLAK